MPTEFSVSLKDQPGTLAGLGGVLGDAGINIEAIAGSSRDGTSRVQFVCSAPDRAAQSLQAAGIAYSTRDVLVVRVLDEPGTLGGTEVHNFVAKCHEEGHRAATRSERSARRSVLVFPNVGAKYRPDYIARRLRDPSYLRPSAHLPALELTDDDIRSIASFLARRQ